MLASPKNAEESNDATMAMESQELEAASIGINDIETEGVFKAADGSPASYFEGDLKDPGSNSNANCVMLINMNFFDPDLDDYYKLWYWVNTYCELHIGVVQVGIGAYMCQRAKGLPGYRALYGV